MYINKKGFSNVLVGAVLMVLALIVAGLLLKNVIFGVDDALEDNKCKQEIEAHIQSMRISGIAKKIPLGMGVQEYVATEIECPTKFETVSGDESDAKEYLAEEMVKCWNTWGRGEQELFPREEGAFCHVCTVAEFENEMDIDDFPVYLADEGYLQELSAVKTENIENIGREIEQVGPQAFPTINTVERQAVVFKYLKGEEYIGAWKKESVLQKSALTVIAGGAIVGAKAGAVTGAVFCSIATLGVGTAPCGLAGAAAGAVGGALGTLPGMVLYAKADVPVERLAYTAVTPYNEEGIKQLGCEYAPAKQ